MRALLVAVGTRGDVQPALALALELRKLGHEARLCTSPNFVDWAKSLGLDAVPMGVEMRAPASKSGSAPSLTKEELRRLRESMPDLITDQFETVGAAVKGCDVIVGANAHQYAAPSIAEHAGIGCVTAVYAPNAIPSRDLAPAPSPGETIDEAVPKSIEEQWRNTAKIWNDRALERINANRARLGMGPIEDVLDYVLTDRPWLAADAALAPAPAVPVMGAPARAAAGPGRAAWAPTAPAPGGATSFAPRREILQTGAWVLADSRPLPAEVEAFLDRGEPPVFVGFGSMPAARDAARWPIAAARAAGRRLIVSQGWADLEVVDDAPDCLVVGDVNHDALFPRIAAVVHHGGAGTTAAAARAGVPQVITPMFGDQFYWGMRIVDLGLGAATPHAAMTEESLTAALREACGPAVVERAREFASRVGRDGAAIAARRLEAEYCRGRRAGGTG